MNWRDILRQVGMLTKEQLWAIDPKAESESLADGTWIWYRDAIWDPGQFHRGAHRIHRALVSSIYLALSPELNDWHQEACHVDVLADAYFTLKNRDIRYWLEADSGKETQSQWLTKLSRYRDSFSFSGASQALAVIAVGQSTRLQRLASWLGQARLPVGCYVINANELARALPLLSQPPSIPPTPALLPPMAAVQMRYCLRDTGDISLDEAQRLLGQGYVWGATEILAGMVIRHLEPPNKSSNKTLRHLLHYMRP
ncbi:MAG: replication-relaxation family protein [Sulfobacillus sp.]